MRRERIEKRQQRLDRFVEQRQVDIAVLVFVHFIYELHDRRDGCVEVEPSAGVFSYLFDGAVHHEVEGLVSCILSLEFGADLSVPPYIVDVFVYESVYTVEESVASLNTLVRPVELLFRRSSEEDEESCCIRTVFRLDLRRAYNVAERFAHLGAVLDDHSLSKQVSERLFLFAESEIVHYHLEESCVHEVQDSVLNSADVLVYVHPVVSLFPAERILIVMRIAVSEEVP